MVNTSNEMVEKLLSSRHGLYGEAKPAPRTGKKTTPAARLVRPKEKNSGAGARKQSAGKAGRSR